LESVSDDPTLSPDPGKHELDIEDLRTSPIGKTGWYLEFATATMASRMPDGDPTIIFGPAEYLTKDMVNHTRVKANHDTGLWLYTKDWVAFPEPVIDPYGHKALAALFSPRVPREFEDHEVFGKYYRETPGIWIAYTKDVVHWYGHREILLPDVLDTKLGPGSTPIKTPHGWLPLNHAVKIEETCESGTRRYITLKEQEAKGEKGDDDTRVYTPQAILLDLHQPHKCIGVSEDLAEPNGWEVNPKLHIKHLMITQAMKGLLVDGQVTKTIIGFYGGGDTSFGALVMDEDYVTNSIYKVPQERIPQPTPKP